MNKVESILKSKKIPFSLDFGYAIYSFSFVESLSDRNGSLMGLSDLNDLKIKFCKSLDSNQFKEVFYHEVFHILVSFSGVVDPETEKLTKMTEEDLVTRMSRAWLMFQNLNKKIIDCINSL